MNCLAVPFTLVMLLKLVLAALSLDGLMAAHGVCAATQVLAITYAFHKIIGGLGGGSMRYSWSKKLP